jgi:hypothetical protein
MRAAGEVQILLCGSIVVHAVIGRVSFLILSVQTMEKDV